jgi:hypothetical protein
MRLFCFLSYFRHSLKGISIYLNYFFFPGFIDALISHEKSFRFFKFKSNSGATSET